MITGIYKTSDIRMYMKIDAMYTSINEKIHTIIENMEQSSKGQCILKE